MVCHEVLGNNPVARCIRMYAVWHRRRIFVPEQFEPIQVVDIWVGLCSNFN
jgi:hypothetical protein